MVCHYTGNDAESFVWWWTGGCQVGVGGRWTILIVNAKILYPHSMVGWQDSLLILEESMDPAPGVNMNEHR